MFLRQISFLDIKTLHECPLSILGMDLKRIVGPLFSSNSQSIIQWTSSLTLQ